jgi:hypothetical protein
MMDGVENLALARRHLGRNRFSEQLGADGERGERRLQLVRQRGDQIGAALFLIAHVSHVLQQHDGPQPLATRTHPGKVAAEIAVVTPAQEQFEFGAVVAGAVTPLLRRRQQFGDVQIARGNFLEPFSLHLVRVEVEDRARDLIYVNDGMIVVEHNEAVLDTFDYGIGFGALVVEFGQARLVPAEPFFLQGLKALHDAPQSR